MDSHQDLMDLDRIVDETLDQMRREEDLFGQFASGVHLTCSGQEQQEQSVELEDILQVLDAEQQQQQVLDLPDLVQLAAESAGVHLQQQQQEQQQVHLFEKDEDADSAWESASSPNSASQAASSPGGIGSSGDEHKSRPAPAILAAPVIKPAAAATVNSAKQGCQVCGDTSAKIGRHCYYGASGVCRCCKAFFRRAVQAGGLGDLACAGGDGDCKIDTPETRRACQRCRFARCVAAGMRVSYVMPESERKAKYNKRNADDGGDGKVVKFRPVPKADPCVGLTLEEMSFLEDLKTRVISAACRTVSGYLSVNHDFTRDLVTLLRARGLSAAGDDPSAGPDPSTVDRYSCHRHFDRLYELYADCVFSHFDEFTTLSMADRRRLAVANGAAVRAFKKSLSIHDYVLAVVLQRVVEEKYVFGCGVADRVAYFRHEDFYPARWMEASASAATSAASEAAHRRTLETMAKWPRSHPDAPLNSTLFILMEVVLSFSTDFVRLDSPKQIEQVQMNYAHLLHRYLKHKFGARRGNAKLAEGVMLAHHARAANQCGAKQF